MFRTAFVLCFAAVCIATGETPAIFKLGTPVRLHDGRGPSLVPYGKSFALLYSRPAGEAKGLNLYFRPALDAKAEIRVNKVAGEVRDGGENGPILLHDEKKGKLYAVWNAADSRHPLANRLHFSFWDEQAGKWSDAITINDDVTPTTHTFQGAAVGPDGSVHVAWLDRRELPVGKPEDYPGGGVTTAHELLDDTVVLYTARWTGGASFTKNVRVAGNVCGCCRATIGFVQNRMLIAWRSVDREGIRDITVATSTDHGQTWTSPRVAVRDGWKINACPHAGPSFTTLGNTLYLAWMTRGDRGPGVFSAASSDGGLTFGAPRLLSDGLSGATHPHLTSGSGTSVAVFQAVSGTEKLGLDSGHSTHGAHGQSASSHAYLSILGPIAGKPPVVSISWNGTGLTYPIAAINQDGTIAVAWTQVQDDRTTAWLVMGSVK